MGMNSDHAGTTRRVIGPSGMELTLENLPPADTRRWVIRRKAEVVAAIRGGLLSVDDACRRYDLSEEEILSWQRLIESHGMMGLRTTRVHQYRHPGKE
jgi:hypothetical protein